MAGFFRRFLVESLEDRRVLSVNATAVTNNLISVQQVGSGGLAVEIELSNPTSSGSTSSNAAPQATGSAEIQINSGVQYTIALPTAFTDAETASADLIFSIAGNTNPSMFSNVSIDAAGNLVLDLLSDSSGTSNLTIQASDGNGGLAAIDVEIEGVTHGDDDPVIDNFTGHQDPNDPDTWTFEGEVVGADDNSDVTIDFGGDLDGNTTTVNTDGSFSFTGQINPDSSSGQVTVQAHSGTGSSSPIIVFNLDDD